MKLEFEITKVTILKLRHGPDHVSLYTTHPSPRPIDDEMWLDFQVSQEDGYRYVTEELGVKPELIEVIDVRRDSEPSCFARRDR